MFNKWTLLIVLGLLARVAVAASTEGDFYVAPNGNDQWSGKHAAPTADKSDGPFATIQQAQKAARNLWAQHPESSRPVTVLVRGGTYSIREPLVFNQADCNTTYAAYGQEKPLITGGVVLSGFKSENGRWTLHLPEVQQGRWNFTQLWVNGQRRYRPRLPKNGYYTIADKLEPTAKNKDKGYDRFKYSDNDIRKDWANLSDVDVLAFQIWTMARMRIADIDEAAKVVTFTGPTRSTQWWSAIDKGKRFLVENVKEALSEPGEWYLDRKSGVLTYIPMPGESLESAQIIAPRAELLVRIEGKPAEKQWVSNLVFRGLAFAHNNWVTPAEGNNFSQAEVTLPGAITATGAINCAFEQCTISGIGPYAIELGAACRNNRIDGCEMTDLAGGGIKIGLMHMETPDDQACGGNVVRDCRLAHGGRMHPAAHGIWIGHSAHNVIEHNDIYDFYYTGISVGWSWGYSPSCGSHHNTLAYNHIYNIGQGVLSDMGGIYTLGLAEGTILHHNLIHHIHAFDYGGWGIYFDEGTTHQTAENNLVYRTKTGGFHQHYGKENIVRNNIFAFALKDQIQRTRNEPHLSFTFERNIVYWNAGPLLGINWKENNYKLDSNLYWRSDRQAIDFAGMTFAQWQAKGQDKNSLIADPLFVDPEHGNFAFKPGSPAEKIGFKPIDLSTVGRRTAGKTPANEESARPGFPLVLPQ
ncbi:MAG TPA: right-handed parallel beta-helix repeat-containing protein [Tepidisphaeraceae bacterium]|nr:right-handed parallel beta-helix repeat-containing protein [Tepidisphaeraceae bacterium]